MISICFSKDYIVESNDYRTVHSARSKKEIVVLVEDVLVMIEGILHENYHYDFSSPIVRAFINTSAMLYALFDVYDVCPTVRLIRCIFDYVSNVATLFAGKPNFECFTLDEKGNFLFIY